MATMEINAALVKKLRDLTGAGMMECKAALTEANGDIEAATTILRKRGLAQATKKAGRSTNEGLIGSYIHMGGKIGVLVEVNCESDFVARTEEFQALAREIAMHIAAANPQYVRREDVPEAVIEKERSVQTNRALEEGKPANIAEKVAEGRMAKFFEEIVLMEQKYFRDEEKTIAQLLQETVATVGESIQIARFARFAIGESESQE